MRVVVRGPGKRRKSRGKYISPSSLAGLGLSAEDVRYKTVLCLKWVQHGRCSYGDKCAFAHGCAIRCEFASAASCWFHALAICVLGGRQQVFMIYRTCADVCPEIRIGRVSVLVSAHTVRERPTSCLIAGFLN